MILSYTVVIIALAIGQVASTPETPQTPTKFGLKKRLGTIAILEWKDLNGYGVITETEIRLTSTNSEHSLSITMGILDCSLCDKVVEGLKLDEQYTASVIFKTTYGYESASAYIQIPSTDPMPTELEQRDRTKDTVTISWRWPQNLNIETVIIKFKRETDVTWKSIAKHCINNCNDAEVLKGLDWYSPYVWSVQSLKLWDSIEIWTEPATATIPIGPIEAPTNVTLLQWDRKTAIFHWDYDYVSIIFEFVIMHRPISKKATLWQLTPVPSSLTGEVTGMNIKQLHEVKIMAVRMNDYSIPSDTIIVQVPVDKPTSILAVRTENTVTLSWTPPTDEPEVDRYLVMCISEDGSLEETRWLEKAEDWKLEMEFEELVWYKGHKCSVKAGVSSEVLSEPITATILKGKPVAPQDVGLVQMSRDTAELKWTYPVDTKYIFKFFMMYGPSSKDPEELEWMELPTSSLTVTLHNLQEIEYNFYLMASNSAGYSPSSEVFTFTAKPT